MKKLFCITLPMVFVFGILFPVSRTREGKSPFIEHIKKVFHYSAGYEKKAEIEKGPVISREGETGFFQEMRNIFHCFPRKEEKKAETKKLPFALDKIFKEQPSKEETK